MTKRTLSTIVAVILMIPCVAAADTILTFQPSPADLGDLDHSYAYGWGIDAILPQGESVIAATLTFDNIRNWDNGSNVLYVNLLDEVAAGFSRRTDNGGGGNYFANYAGDHVSLVTYLNLPSWPQDLVYAFTADQVDVLNDYLANGKFGIGIDPDCHFYNDGVELCLVTPEPGTVALLAAGLPFVIRRRTAR